MGKKKYKLINELKNFKMQNNIENMYLFGSRVHGKIHQWSDVDLIVVSKNFRGKGLLHRAPDLYMKWNLEYPVDFLCYTPEEFNKLKRQITIVREAVKEGIEIK
ncbi:nucleotidyltransferase domain-containing protein [Candidatus Woesearchaeota archaeon]|nr:nucleotidyltransferase domain-containing protein [Candidatus Woesearchaeota archaeon]